MSHLSRIFTLAAPIALLGAAAAPASAGTLDFSAYGWMATFDDNIDLTILSADDTGIVLSLQKFADFTAPPDAAGVYSPLNIVFRQTSPNAVSRIAIEEETVLNDTGYAWGGFEFALASSTSNAVSFDPSASADFNIDPFSSKQFSDNDTLLTVSDGVVESGNFPSNLWQPGRNGGALFINANPFSSGSTLQTFVFSETPIIIPLPSAAAISLLGLGAVMFRLTRSRNNTLA